ncbi:MAG: ABC transporter permease [Bacteroidia bacterium]
MLFFTLFKESVYFAWHSLAANKLRTFLSLLGITIGIFAIIFVFTIVDSLENNIRSSIQSLGDNVVFVQKWPWTFGPDYPWWKYMNRPVPKYDEIFDVQRKAKTAEAMAFRVGGRRTLKFKGNIVENAVVAGVSYDFYKIKTFEIPDGRYFTEAEVSAGYNVAIIGYKIAEGLFPNTPAVGQEIKIAGKKAYVIGVFKKEGESMLGNTMDNQVIVPFNFARLLLDVKSENSDPYIAVKAKPGVTNAQMIDELTGIMRGVRHL